MARRSSSRNFKSPPHKLVTFFLSGRDKWRERARNYRKTARTLNITVRDLQKSRDGWKEKFIQERDRRLQLEAQLEHPPPRVEDLARPTSPTVAGHR